MDSDGTGSGPKPQWVDTEGRPARMLRMSDPDGWTFGFGDSRWALWYRYDGEAEAMTFAARVHLNPSPDAITVTGVAIVSFEGEPVTASDLRDLPVAKLSRIVNQRRLAEHIRHLDSLPANSTDWNFDPTNLGFPWELFSFVLPAKLTVEYKIPGIDQARRPDGFYADVADAWASAVLNGEPSAAQTLADANGVEAGTVYRWVREARRRGVMAASPRAARPDDDPE